MRLFLRQWILKLGTELLRSKRVKHVIENCYHYLVQLSLNINLAVITSSTPYFAKHCMRLPRTLLRSSVFYLAAKSLMKLGSFGEDIPCHTWLGPRASMYALVCKYALLRIAPLNGPRLSSARKTSQQTGPCACDATPEFPTNNFPQVGKGVGPWTLDTTKKESSFRHNRRRENEIILPVMDCMADNEKKRVKHGACFSSVRNFADAGDGRGKPLRLAGLKRNLLRHSSKKLDPYAKEEL